MRLRKSSHPGRGRRSRLRLGRAYRRLTRSRAGLTLSLGLPGTGLRLTWQCSWRRLAAPLYRRIAGKRRG